MSKRPAETPATLDKGVVYSEEELDTLEATPADRERYYNELREMREKGQRPSYTPGALEMVRQAAVQFGQTANIDPFVPASEQQIAALPENVQTDYWRLRQVLEESKVGQDRPMAHAPQTEPKQPAPAPSAPLREIEIVQMKQIPTIEPIVPPPPFAPQSQSSPPAASALVPQRPMNRNASLVSLITNGAPPRLGDTQTVVANYENLSLCNQVTEDALKRAHAAMQILDKEHASAIAALLDKASNKSRNASHPGKRPITFKKAASIALKAERWVYQAQAAAAKQMVTKSKKCLHDMAGRRRRTTEEKERTYAKRAASGQSGYVGVRPKGSSAQAFKRAQKRLAYLQDSKSEHMQYIARVEARALRRKAAKDAAASAASAMQAN